MEGHTQDTLHNTYLLDKLTIHKSSRNLWIGANFRVGDTILSAHGLASLIRNNRQSYQVYKSSKTNHYVSSGAFVWSLLGIVSTGVGLANKENVFPYISATVIGTILGEIFRKKANRQLNTALSLYNSKL
jgi:hypothetical protein